jgi:hypothetical protein
MTDNAVDRPRTEDEPMDVNDWELQAQARAEAHLEGCREAYYHEDEHDAAETCEDCPPQVSLGPYDDCTTCIVREVLDAAWPILAELAVAEYFRTPAGSEPSWRRP